MLEKELVQALDYILNRCDEAAIDAVAEAVMRRRRELALFGGKARLPDPKKLSKELAGQVNAASTIEGLRKTVEDMAVRIIRREAPELSGGQIAELISAWIPGSRQDGTDAAGAPLPPRLMLSMIDQFAAFSVGRMSAGEDKKLRKELSNWPERYWEAFPEVIRLLLREYIGGETDERTFRNKLRTALSL